MRIHFILIKQGKTRSALPVIYLQVFDSRFKDRKFLYSTKQAIDEKQWDSSSQRPKARHLTSLSQHLNTLRNRVEQFQATKLNASSLDKDELRRFLDSHKVDERKAAEEKLRNENDFFKLWEEIIETTRRQGHSISSGTKTQKRQSRAKVSEFCTESRLKPTLQNINKDFYLKFVSWMESKGLSPNTVGRHIKELKALLREADDRGYSVSTDYTKKSFRVIHVATESTYLNVHELRKLHDLKLTGALAVHRDTFLLGCFTGLRHSDWHQVRSENVEIHQGSELIKVRQQKTNHTVFIPVHPVVRQIWARHNGNPPKGISRQKVAEAIRSICKKADLGEVTLNGKRVEKWTTISTHTARRSFCTNAYLAGDLNIRGIMAISGHKTEASFLRYLKLSERDYAEKAASSRFFSEDFSSLKIA